MIDTAALTFENDNIEVLLKRDRTQRLEKSESYALMRLEPSTLGKSFNRFSKTTDIASIQAQKVPYTKG